METKNVTISKEYLDRIRRFAAIRPEEQFVYVPIAFRDLPEEIKPKFTLRPISGEDALRFSDSMRGEVQVENGKATIAVKRGEFTINVVAKGLVRWDNYYDGEGRIVDFIGTATNLPITILEELCEAILSRASLSQEEVLGLK